MRREINISEVIRLVSSLLLMVILVACSETTHGSSPGEQQVSRRPPQVAGGDPDRGETLIRDYGCGSCHQIPGIRAADGNVGPPLTNWADRQYIAGTLPNTPENLIHWIRFPQAVEPGTVMPNLEVTEEEARDMAAYLYTLTEEGQFTEVFSTPRSAIGEFFSGSDAEEGSATEEPTTAAAAAGGEEQGTVPNTGQQGESEQAAQGTTTPAAGSEQGGSETLAEQGEQVFSNNCASCHGPEGEGQVGPALAGNPYVTAPDPGGVIHTVQDGRGQMPAFRQQLSQEQLAAVVSYIRTAWGNEASTVEVEQVDVGQIGTEREGLSDQTASQQETPSGDQQGGQGQQATPTSSGAQSEQQVTPAPGAGGGPAPAQETQPAYVPPHSVLVEIYEWGIDMTSTTLPSERVLFHVTNVGTRPHRFTIEGQGMELAYPVDIPVGETRTLSVDLRSGQYRIFCPLDDHAARGISQEFTAVEEEDPDLFGVEPEPATPSPAPQATPTPEEQNGQPTPTPSAGGQSQGQQATATPETGSGQGQQATATPSGGDQTEQGQQATPTPGSQQQGGQDQQATPTQSAGEQGQGQSGGGEQLVQQGEQVFSNNCASCHGQNGQGQVGPALAGSEFVTSDDPAQVIDTVLHGRGQMPAFQDQLSNQQIAAVISYIRNSWGNNASTVSPDQIGGGQGQNGQQGGQNQGGQSGGQQSGQSGAPQQVTIDLTAQNRAFDQNHITVPPGAQVTVNMTNLDRVPHNFAVYGSPSLNQSIFIGQIFTGPNQTVTYQFTAPAQPGNYFFRCDVHPFMNGQFIVQ